jgi:large subunit ribosomal protein L35
MPKLKTQSGAMKRFKVTGTGKLIHKGAGKGHHMEVKTSRHARRISMDTTLPPSEAKKIRRLLGK